MNTFLCKYSNLALIVGMLLFTGAGHAQENDLETMFESLPVVQKDVVYKTIGDVALHMHIYKHVDRDPEESVPALVLFFGGGWSHGTLLQFAPHCRYFATRGMVTIAAEYRVKNRHGTSPFECVADGKSAVRWVRSHAHDLGIDPDRIAVGGCSAGGHVALCTALIDGFEDKNEEKAISSVPDALVLFNPVVDATKIRRNPDIWEGHAEDISPVHHIGKNLPPAIIFHGTADTVVLFDGVERFCRLMKDSGNRCEIVPFEGMKHAFFNWGKHENKPFVESIIATDRFLFSLGYLSGKPSIIDGMK